MLSNHAIFTSNSIFRSKRHRLDTIWPQVASGPQPTCTFWPSVGLQVFTIDGSKLMVSKGSGLRHRSVPVARITYWPTETILLLLLLLLCCTVAAAAHLHLLQDLI